MSLDGCLQEFNPATGNEDASRRNGKHSDGRGKPSGEVKAPRRRIHGPAEPTHGRSIAHGEELKGKYAPLGNVPQQMSIIVNEIELEGLFLSRHSMDSDSRYKMCSFGCPALEILLEI